MSAELSLADWLGWWLYQMSLSLLAVGGAMTLAPEMHRYMVDEHRWLSDTQFSTAFTLAQAAPGPNVLFLALLGWQIGEQAAGPQSEPMWRMALAACGVLVALSGALLPSSLLTYGASRWIQAHQQRLAVRAFQRGMAPLVVGVMLSTAYVIGQRAGVWSPTAGWWALALGSAWLVYASRLHILWMLGAGAVLGALLAAA